LCQLIQPRSQISKELAIVSVPNRSFSKSSPHPRVRNIHQSNSTQLSSSFSTQPSSSRYFPYFPSNSLIPLSPIITAPTIKEMTSIVKNQQNPINSSLLLTNIEKLNALNLHFPEITWLTFVNSSLEIGSSNTLLATPNFKLGSEELSYISTILPTNIFLIAICPLTPENSSSSTTSSPHFSTIETSTFSHLKPPHSPNRPSSRKRFHPYPKSLPNKKTKNQRWAI
jgi:hypothetical protein